MRIPSVIARALPEARLLLEEAGVRAISVVETGPPGRPPTGPVRVVRERWREEGVELVSATSVALAENDGTHV